MKYLIVIGAFLAPILAYFLGKFKGKEEDTGSVNISNPLQDMKKEVEESDEKFKEMSLDELVNAANDYYSDTGPSK